MHFKKRNVARQQSQWLLMWLFFSGQSFCNTWTSEIKCHRRITCEYKLVMLMITRDKIHFSISFVNLPFISPEFPLKKTPRIISENNSEIRSCVFYFFSSFAYFPFSISDAHNCLDRKLQRPYHYLMYLCIKMLFVQVHPCILVHW